MSHLCSTRPGDIRDPIAYVQSIIVEQRRKSTLRPEQWEEMEGDLLLDLTKLNDRYDITKTTTGQTFSTYAGRILRMRADSWYRSQPGLGDSRYLSSKRRAILVEIDAEDRDQLAATIQDPGILETINTAILTPDSRETFELIVRPMVEHGLTITEIADAKNLPRRDVTRNLKALRREIETRCLAA